MRSTKKIEEQQTRICEGCFVDHLSTWISNAGTLFFLNEPYGALLKNPSDLLLKGFVHVELPLKLSPYCGGSLNNNAPGTKSYLITERANQDELLEIYEKLKQAELTAPDWNDASEVSNV